MNSSSSQVPLADALHIPIISFRASGIAQDCFYGPILADMSAAGSVGVIANLLNLSDRQLLLSPCRWSRRAYPASGSAD
jgi:hypothetical protein